LLCLLLLLKLKLLLLLHARRCEGRRLWWCGPVVHLELHALGPTQLRQCLLAHVTAQNNHWGCKGGGPDSQCINGISIRSARCSCPWARAGGCLSDSWGLQSSHIKPLVKTTSFALQEQHCMHAHTALQQQVLVLHTCHDKLLACVAGCCPRA
jgi:hypothetical protein